MTMVTMMLPFHEYLELPRWCSSKESTCQCRRCRFNPQVRRAPGAVNGNPLQYSCLENSIDRGAWRATVHGVAKSRTQLSTHTHTQTHTHTHKQTHTQTHTHTRICLLRAKLVLSAMAHFSFHHPNNPVRLTYKIIPILQIR